MKVLVGMSGGVDSSVVAALLKHNGAEVEGVYFHQVSEPEYSCEGNVCCGEAAIARARDVAKNLGIHLHVVNLMSRFESEVINPTKEAMDSGLNPAPCNMCNSRVRGPMLQKYANVVGADYWATGHYFQNLMGDVYMGVDPHKDQSYMMALVDKTNLSRWLTPLGGLNKPFVRELAAHFGLSTASTPDSQNLCFSHLLTKKNRSIFLNEIKVGQIDAHPVVGQRKGMLGYYATEVGNDFVKIEKTKPMVDKISIQKLNWIAPVASNGFFKAMLRYHGNLIETELRDNCVHFSEPQTINSGQVIAFYDRTQLLGGAVAV